MLLNKTIPIWFIFKKIRSEFIIVSIYSIILGILEESCDLMEISIPFMIPSILGTAISLLLAFRTNQAYERWWEARIIWGSIVNNSRSLIREVQTFFPESAVDTVQKFINHQVAWCYVLGQSLRGLEHKEILKDYLSEEEIKLVTQHSNIPNALLSLHSKEIREAYKNKTINEFQQIQLDTMIAKLCDDMGKCERIKGTVFPRTYTILLYLFIYVFAFILPFSLMNYSGIAEIIINITVTSIFFLIEKTAIYKQDPFENRPTDISVTSLARKIEINLLQMNNNDNIPEEIKAEDYYLM